MPIGSLSGAASGGTTVGESAFGECRRERNRHKTFNANEFVNDLVKNMKTKHKEYETAWFKSFTRFEEKCDFVDNVIFPALKSCSKEQTEVNVKALVDALEQGVKKFTTGGVMSGLAMIFEWAYFSLTRLAEIPERTFLGFDYLKKVPVVDVANAQFQMNDKTMEIVSGKEHVVQGVVDTSVSPTTAVVGVLVNRQDCRPNTQVSARTTTTQNRFHNQVAFFNLMDQVRVPQAPVVSQAAVCQLSSEEVAKKVECFS